MTFKNGIIKLFPAPIVLIRKNDTDLHFRSDHIRLDEIAEKDLLTFSYINSTSNTALDAKQLSTLDLASDYQQTTMKLRDSYLSLDTTSKTLSHVINKRLRNVLTLCHDRRFRSLT